MLNPNLNAIDGLNIVDDPDITEILLRLKVGLGVELNAIAASVRGEGNMEGTISLDLDSATGATNGKIYYDELIATLSTNPFPLFDASGSLTAGFAAGIDTIFAELWRRDSPRVTIRGFGFDGVTDPVYQNLATKSGGTLTLNTGDRAGNRSIATPNFDLHEAVQIERSVKTGALT